MNEMPAFDQYLESELRRLLDPVTETPAPPFKARRRVAVMTAPIALSVEMVVAADPVAIPVPVEPVGA